MSDLNLNPELEADFYKKGSKFGGSDFGINLGNVDVSVQYQIVKLGMALSKYSSISSERRRKIVEENMNLPQFRYMNMEYLAAVLEIMEMGRNEGYKDIIFEYFKYIFENEKFFKDKYLSKITKSEKESQTNYIFKIKRTMITYLQKIINYRNG